MTAVTDAPAKPQTIITKLWIATRFLLFGVGGLLPVSWGTGMFVEWLTRRPYPSYYLNPAVYFLALVLGAVMILYGTGKWGQWRYLWVVPSVIVFFVGILLIAVSLPNSVGHFLEDILPEGKLSAIPVAILAALPAIYAARRIRRYYSRQARN